ncbi:protein kinase, partial [Candidatus Woesearchaeota archaeon]|nr:protein kinase [Candidatus Woesearchaeota archaeon]
MRENYTKLSGVRDYSFERLIHTSRDGYDFDTSPSTIVWRAQQNGQEYAVKRLKSKRNWRKERKLIDKLPQHPNLAIPLDAFRTIDGNFIVQELAEGRQMPRSLHGYYELTLEQLFSYVQQIGDAIDELNKTHVHCDLRIPNIIVNEGVARIIDFGLAGKIGSHYLTYTFDGAWDCIPEHLHSWRVQRTPEIDQHSLQHLLSSVMGETAYRNEQSE